MDRVVLEVVVADITTLKVDAIVNAANSSLLGGGGVDGAIHRAAGPELVARVPDARRLRDRRGERSPRATGFRQGTSSTRSARYGAAASAGEDDRLASCYRASLSLARDHGLASIAFPSISTGIYGFPADRAAEIAVATVREETGADAGALTRVVFCCFDETARAYHLAALGRRREG